MSRANEDGSRKEDPFWEIALNYDGKGNAFDDLYCNNHSDDDSKDDNDQEEDHALSGTTTTYHLPNSSVSLELAPLVSNDGVFSPVGDHAWYSSALLTCLILQGTFVVDEEKGVEGCSGGSDKKRKILDDLSGDIGEDGDGASKEVRILELGSGAIGLSGIACAVALSQQKELFPSWTVSLTDNDTSLLKQLEANVRFNINSKNIVLSSSENVTESLSNKNINVEYLDWDLGYDGGNGDEETDERFASNNQEWLLSADIVIGSELVYTRETALALVKILLTLLNRNPTVKIWIVQVTDRYGWKEIVIPALESAKNIIIENIPLAFDLHEIAATMIPMGGALDRYAFGAFRISNRTTSTRI